jgi:hypothetical protein
MHDIKPLAATEFWLLESLSAPCLDCPGTALGRRRPGESPMWIAQTIGIESLVGLSLAAGEEHITFSLALGEHFVLAPLRCGSAHDGVESGRAARWL